MAILPIAKLGEPVLRQVAAEVDPAELAVSETQQLIDDMIETMRSVGGLGLAAPQVFVSKRIAVIEPKPNARYPDAAEHGLLVVVNPVFSNASPILSEGWEGCLSIDNLRGRVPRHTSITVAALDRDGQPFRLDAQGFLAVVLQHELDHLWGKLFIDRMTDMSSLCHQEQFEQYVLTTARQV